MNKYEARAEAVLKKREEYNIKRAEKANRIIRITAVTASFAVVAGIGIFFNRQIKKPLPPEVVPNVTQGATQSATIASAYNGKPVFISKEIKKRIKETV